MNKPEQFLSQRQRYRPITLPQDFSDEEMFRDWQLSPEDCNELKKYQKRFRLHLAIQICAVRLYGRILLKVHDLSPRIASHLRKQLGLPPALKIQKPEREATYVEQLQKILKYLGFKRFDESAQQDLDTWLRRQVQQNFLPEELFEQAEIYLFEKHVLLPGPSVLERLVIRVCSEVHLQLFESVFQQLSPEHRQAIDQLLSVPEAEQRSYFSHLKDYPPAATITTLQTYLQRYKTVVETGIDNASFPMLTSAFLGYLFKQAKRYNASDLKRFNRHKRYALMVCFLVETRKILLDHLVAMHDQYMLGLSRRLTRRYEKQHREFRQRQKKAVDVVLETSGILFDLLGDQPLTQTALCERVDETQLRSSLADLQEFKRLEERGYADLLIGAYPTLRKYFAEFIQLPFAAAPGSETLLRAIELVRQLDTEELKCLPSDTPTHFVPQNLRKALRKTVGTLNRNAWEMGIAFAIKDALRSGDLYLPQSKHHISFWDLTLSETATDDRLEQPTQQEVKAFLTGNFQRSVTLAQDRFPGDSFAQIEENKLKLSHYAKVPVSPEVNTLQRVINARLPLIRIERLLIEVDQLTRFSRHFKAVSGHQSQPRLFYKTLLAALIAQATNLGVVAMSASVEAVTVDMLRRVLQDYVREETLIAASAEIVNQHHALLLSSVHGTGELSSSDAQRFGVRASSLLASYYPRYYGYYEKAIGIYTHVSDQYSVFSTKVISCSPREALYVLDGLLENNTVLPIRSHTTDTHGYTEILFALCHLLGFYFMPVSKT